jgi:Ca2+-binding RTX toxin-like protein
MANYTFETILPDQAGSYNSASDTLAFSNASAHGNNVLVVPEYSGGSATSPSGLMGVVLTDTTQLDPLHQSVTFGAGLAGATATFTDTSVLFVGQDPGSDNFTGTAMGDGLYGFVGDDTLIGGSGADIILGNAGNDFLEGDAGSDTLYAGKGDDTINATGNGAKDHDLVNGNLGNDVITVDGSGSSVYGGQGNDVITDNTGGNFLSGDLGNDSLIGVAGNDTLFGGSGDDTIIGASTGVLLLHGDDGNDVIVVSGVHNGLFDVNAGANNDILILNDTGTGASIYHGGNGDDFISASGAVGGTDTAKAIWGDVGNDSIIDSNSTNDVINGGDGNDSIQALGDGAHSGVWVIDAGTGNDTVTVDHTFAASVAGNDHIALGEGDDTITVISGAATNVGENINGNAGNDLITAGAATSTNDTLFGGAGDDTIDATAHGGGHESLSGDDGNDLLKASNFGDTLNGGAGDDHIVSGFGKDVMFGGGGSDTFSFAPHTSSITLGSQDQILDWESSDKLQFVHGAGSAGNFTEYAGPQVTDYASAVTFAQNISTGFQSLHYVAVQVGGDVVIFSGNGEPAPNETADAVVLVGRSLSDINYTNIV